MKKIVNINSLTILILAISLVLLIARVFFLASTVNEQQEKIENLEDRIAKIEKHYNETEELSAPQPPARHISPGSPPAVPRQWY